MPNSQHTSVIVSPSSRRATKRRRSSITELAFHGINTSRQKAKSVTHVSGTKCHPSLRPLTRSSADEHRATNADDAGSIPVVGSILTRAADEALAVVKIPNG